MVLLRIGLLKMKKCDICLNECNDLNELLSIYKTDHIKHVCPGCNKIIDEHLLKCKTVTNNILKDLLHRYFNFLRLKNEKI